MKPTLPMIDTIEALAPELSEIAEKLAVAYRAVERRRTTDRTPAGKQALLAALSEVRRHVAAVERLGGTVTAFMPLRVEFRVVRGGRPMHATWVDGPNARFVWREEDLRATRFRSKVADWLSVLGRDLGIRLAAAK